MNKVIKEELYGSYCKFMKEAGVLAWDLRAEPYIEDLPRANILAALADIEDDSRFMQKKLRHAGALREIPIIEFNQQWLCEEQEHATALRTLARLRGSSAVPVEHGLGARDVRSIFAVLGLRIGRIHPQGITATYLALGAIQEYIALSAYVILSESAHTDNEKNILKNIARQEGRHMRFYRTGAESILSNGAPYTRGFTRLILDQYWRPPGVDLLGLHRWLELFGVVLDQPGAYERFLGADRILSSLPGLEDVDPMNRFLARHRPHLVGGLAAA